MPVGACEANGISMRTDAGVDVAACGLAEEAGRTDAAAADEICGSTVVPGAVSGSASMDEAADEDASFGCVITTSCWQAVRSSADRSPIEGERYFIGRGRRYRRCLDG